MKKRILNPLRIGALAILLAAVPGLVTCDHASPESLYIVDALALPVGNCVLRPGQTATQIHGYGVLDLMITNQYWLFPHLRNFLDTLATLTGEGPSSLQSEVNYITVKRAKVFVDMGEFTPSAVKTSTTPKDTPANLALGYKYGTQGVEWIVNASMAPKSDSVVEVQAIPPELGNLLDTKMKDVIDRLKVLSPAVWITIYVTVTGQTLDGHVMHSNEFSYPVMLCWGCLVNGFCSGTVSTTPCIIGQDDLIDPDLCPYVANNPDACFPKCFPGQ